MRTVVFILITLAGSAFAYPIPPQTLWDVTRAAEVIVVAHIDSVRQTDYVEDEDRRELEPSHFATLTVTETLKGDAKGVITVPYDGNMVCPAPPEYRAGQVVVAFLTRRGASWDTVDLSYGTRYPGDAKRLADMKQVIALASTMPQRGGSDEEPPMSWVLTAISHPATRWDGLFALHHEADGEHSSYSQRPSTEPASPIVLAAVESAFLERPSFDSTLPMMLRLLASSSSPAVTRVAADALESVMRVGPAPWWADETMNLLEVRLDLSPPDEPDAGFDKGLSWLERATVTREQREKTVQTRWAALKARAKLTPKPRADFRPASRSRSGGDSPL
jgi:hypothetical protein